MHFKNLIPFRALRLLVTAGIAFLLALGYLFYGNPEMRFFSKAAGVKKAWAQKMTREHGAKTLIFGGSSCAFSIDGEQLLREDGIPMVNMGLHAGLMPTVLTNWASVTGTCDVNVSDCAGFDVTTDESMVSNPLIGTQTDLSLEVLVEDKTLIDMLPPGASAYVPATTFVPGDNLSYQITIRNEGTGISAGWTMVAPIPVPLTAAQAAAVRASIVITSYTDPSCTVDPVTPPANPAGDMYNLNCQGEEMNFDTSTWEGDSVVITYTVPTPPDQLQVIHEPVTLTPKSPSLTPGLMLLNGFADAYPDLLTVVKEVSSITRDGTSIKPPVMEGDVINYKVTVTNDSDDSLFDLTIDDNFNGGVSNMTFDTCVLDGTTPEPVTGQLVDEFGADHVLVCQVAYTVTAEDVAGASKHPDITNRATASAWTDANQLVAEQTSGLSNLVKTRLVGASANTGGSVIAPTSPIGVAMCLLMVLAGGVILVRRRLAA